MAAALRVFVTSIQHFTGSLFFLRASLDIIIGWLLAFWVGASCLEKSEAIVRRAVTHLLVVQLPLLNGL